MLILLRIERDYDKSQVFKFNDLDEIRTNLKDIITKWIVCQFSYSDDIAEYIMNNLITNGTVYMWEVSAKVCHSAYPYEHHRLVLINTDDLKSFTE